MNLRIKALGIVIVIAVLGTALGACGSQATPTAAPEATSPEPTEPPASSGEVVELTYFYRITSPPQASLEEEVVAAFNEAFAGKIHVTGSGVDDETYKTKQLVVLQSDDAPDVFYSWEGGRALQLIEAGFVLPLDQYYTKYGWDTALSPAGQMLATYDGKKMFVPYQMSSAQVWYRVDIFDKYNLQPPTTWAELENVVDVLKANGVQPFVMPDKEAWESQFEWSAILVNKHGLQTYQDLVDNKIPWTDPRVVDAFAVLKEMVDDGWYHTGILSMGLSDGVVPMAKGESAMWYNGNWVYALLAGEGNTAPEYPVDWFPWPAMSSEFPAVMENFCENALMINANSRNPDAAAEFVNFYIQPEWQERFMYEALAVFPGNMNASTSMLPDQYRRLYDVMGTGSGYSFMHPDHALLPAIANTFLIQLQGVLGGEISPADAAAATEAEAVRARGEVK